VFIKCILGTIYVLCTLMGIVIAFFVGRAVIGGIFDGEDLAFCKERFPVQLEKCVDARRRMRATRTSY
jgi:hypothetical protein